MKRFSILALLLFFSVATMQSCHAIIWTTAIEKGKIPGMVRTPELRKTLATIAPLGGTSTEGSWNNCTLYYRSTQKDLQGILDSLSELKKIQLIVVTDKSKTAGRVESTKHRPLPRTLVYQFSISVSGDPFLSDKGGETVSVVIHKSAGIDPAKLQIPKDARVITKPPK